MTDRPQHRGKKLLVAAVGVATASYVASGCPAMETSGNLMAPPPEDAALPQEVVQDSQAQAFDAFLPGTGNLLPPPPVDASTPDAATIDAGDAGDADAGDAAAGDGGDAGDGAVSRDAGDAS